MISRFFIERPIFSCVLSAFVLLGGLAAATVLPVALLPDILPPEVSVVATYPGASAQTVAETVAAPLEQAVNGVENMLYMSSVSANDGSLALTVTFKTGTDPDLAAVNVNNRLQSVLPRVPEEVRREGITVTKKASAFLGVIALSSPRGSHDTIFLNNYATLNVADELKRIPGVGQVLNFASKDYSIRIWLKLDRLSQLDLTAADVARAVREQNSPFAAGSIGRPPQEAPVDFTYAVTSQERLSQPRQFENIILRAGRDGTIVRLGDVARVELGAKSYDFTSTVDGRPAATLGIMLLPGANALQAARLIKQRMKELQAAFPADVTWSFPYDTTTYLSTSVGEVLLTLLEAVILVFAVVLLFLQSWRATLIPMLAVPVSLVGTLIVLQLLGFSVNTLTLFGLVLAIGIVVDDAIVVLENVQRIMDTEKLEPREATLKTMSQVERPVISIVLVLVAVFAPVAFLGGFVGEMYRQFAVTIAAAVMLSGVVALTLTPALCSALLRKEERIAYGGLRWFNGRFFDVCTSYTRGVKYLLSHSLLGCGLLILLFAASAAIYRAIPGALLPEEDQGWVLALSVLPDAASAARTAAVNDSVSARLREHPAIEHVVSFSGWDPVTQALRSNTGASWIILRNWGERRGGSYSVDDIARYASSVTRQVKDALVLIVRPPPIQGISNTGGFEAFIQAHERDDPQALQKIATRFAAAAGRRPELAGVTISAGGNAPQLHLQIKRDKAMILGVAVSDISTTLQSTLGAYYINDFNKAGRVFQVQMQAEGRFRAGPENVRDIYVRSVDGQMVPLLEVADVTQVSGPELVQRFNGFPAAALLGGPAPGYSSGQALQALEEVANRELPPGYTLAWSGAYHQEKLSGGWGNRLLALGVVMVFLILAALYENWIRPVAVLLVLPIAVFGALGAVWLRGLTNDIFFQIGMLTLIGLSVKNAILIVEFAIMKSGTGATLEGAALEAARLRFRPIVMTSLAFIFGVLPLALGTGAGAGSRHSIGTGVIGGMLFSTFAGTLFTPLFFWWIEKLRRNVTADPML